MRGQAVFLSLYPHEKEEPAEQLEDSDPCLGSRTASQEVVKVSDPFRSCPSLGGDGWGGRAVGLRRYRGLRPGCGDQAACAFVPCSCPRACVPHSLIALQTEDRLLFIKRLTTPSENRTHCRRGGETEPLCKAAEQMLRPSTQPATPLLGTRHTKPVRECSKQFFAQQTKTV